MEKTQRNRASFWVFFASCVAFLVMRFLIVFSSVDHLGHTAPEELNVAHMAGQILDDPEFLSNPPLAL